MLQGLEYGTVKYWDDRYLKQKDKVFDWVSPFMEIRPLFDEHILQPLF